MWCDVVVSKDGVLVVEAPVDSANYKAIRMNPETGLAIQPSGSSGNRELAIKRKLRSFLMLVIPFTPR